MVTLASHSVCGPRLVHSGSGCRSPSLGSDLTFATRTGSRQGIEMHLFRVETHRDLSTWTRILVQGCHAAAELIKEVSLGRGTFVWPFVSLSLCSPSPYPLFLSLSSFLLSCLFVTEPPGAQPGPLDPLPPLPCAVVTGVYYHSWP